jgi:ubiquinone/menaquinone biosynthesis C-methylase UbiE
MLPMNTAVKQGDDLVLELGCGARKRHPEAICIDAIEYDGVDIVGDIYEELQKFPENCVRAVYSYHCFEHLPDIGAVLDELARVMQPDAELIVVAPHFSNPYFYSDCTHRVSFGLYTFAYFAEENLFSRKVPRYAKSVDFELRSVKLIFKSPKPYYFRWGFKKLFEWFFNLGGYLAEFYEENLCYLIPCYEVKYELRKK